MSGLTDMGIKYVLDGQGNATVVGSVGKPCALAIPSRVGTHAVTGIESRAFFQDYLLRHVSLPPTIRHIGEEAFAGAGIERLKVPDGVASVGRRAFASCGRLRLASLPGTVTTVPEGCFQGCGHLAMLVLGYGIEAIRTNAFEGCASLVSVSLPETVRSIGDLAFAFCTHLAAIDLPRGGIELGEGAFTHCDALSSIAIPPGTRSIPAWAFSKCVSLSDVTLGEGLLSIGKRAFRGCASLRSLDVPHGVAVIGDEAMYGCRSLEYMGIPGSVKEIGRQAFSWCHHGLECRCETGSYADGYCLSSGLGVIRDDGAPDTPPAEGVEEILLMDEHGSAHLYRVLSMAPIRGDEYVVALPLESASGWPAVAECYRLVRIDETTASLEQVRSEEDRAAIIEWLKNGMLSTGLDYLEVDFGHTGGVSHATLFGLRY